MIPLIVSLTGLLIMSIDKDTRELFKQERSKLGILSRAMSRSINNAMLQEGPHGFEPSASIT